MIGWETDEHRNIDKICSQLPLNVIKKYELWKNVVYHHGPDKLREFPGFHDEKLIGGLKGK